MSGHTPGRLYAERDIEQQGQHYIDHVRAMTAEGLHSKSDIAAELAHRDIQRDELLAALDKANASRIAAQTENEALKAERAASGVAERRAVREAVAQLTAQRDEILAALKTTDEFLDQIKQDIHGERIADWYPEGAHNAADAMSESMRLIGNRIADFDVARAAIAKVEKS